MKVGGLTVQGVLDGRAMIPLHEALSRDGDWVWDSAEHPLDPEGRLVMDVGAYLIRGGGRVVLVDAGVGPVDKPDTQGGALPANLERLGVRPQDVTDLVFTHLHYDHVGWATQKGALVFPAATVRVHAADWAHFVTGPAALPGAQRKLGPLAAQLELFERDAEILPGLFTRHTPGHSPGHTAFVLKDGGETALLLGDAAHVIPELTDPAWLCRFDIDPREAQATRARLTAEALALGCPVSASHFPGLGFGILSASDGRLGLRMIDDAGGGA